MTSVPRAFDPVRNAKVIVWDLVNQVFPEELRADATRDREGCLIWPLSMAGTAMETLELAERPIVAGEAWLSSGGNVSNDSLIRGFARTPRVRWIVRREDGEDMDRYAARTRDECRARLVEAEQLAEAHGPGAEISVRLQWMDPAVVGRFDLPPELEHPLNEITRDGHAPWGVISAAHAVCAGDARAAGGGARGSFGGGLRSDPLDEVPSNARYLVTGHAFADIAGLARLNRLRVLRLMLPARKNRRESGIAALEAISGLHSLEALDLSNLDAPDLTPLAALPKLKHLSLYCPRITGLRGIEGLQHLETLDIDDGRHVQTLDGLAALPRLRGLDIAGDMHTSTKLASLTPLSAVQSLRSIRFISVRVADGLLRPLAALPALTFISLPNYFSRVEFAELTAAFPDAQGGKTGTIWFMAPRPGGGAIGSCRQCGEFHLGMTIGKPRLRLCPKCDVEKIEKFTQRYDAMVAAALARQSGERNESRAQRRQERP